ncbi:hypothetical protein MesoLj113a_08850 [Mesorhizobium sp. 113-1-2]|uniref:hypothetical protein n=1 Tax=Mesorhizobium sp. 113-1-2 TaxID=2744515 RepID=UPI0019283F70|nr:hypothetical protein [Mesorhizobium sp. 113-1-2]BCG69727.1 hypothetical protein MesoLj113a_08850 [Mesorhizobium sp. 113-1-2]
MFQFFSRYFGTYKVKCPDGTTKIVHRDIDQAFPLSIKGWEGSVTAKLKAQGNVDGDISGAYKTKIESLLIAFDEYNSNIMLDFRAAYVVFQADPCSNGEYLPRSVERISSARAKQIDLTTKINALIEIAKSGDSSKNHKQFMDIFGDVVGRLIPQATAPLAVEEIREATDTAKDFIES